MTEPQKYGQSQTTRIFENDLMKIEKAQKSLLCDIYTALKSIDITIQSEHPDAILYNTNETFIITDTGSLTFAANTYHSISFAIVSGSASITEGTVTIPSITFGYTGESTATTKLTNAITITGLVAGTTVIIKTMK